MPELSPAAQAVWEAFNEEEAGVFVDFGEKLAAALDAAADQVVPEETWLGTKEPCYAYYCQRSITRRQLLAIAAELKAHD